MTPTLQSKFSRPFLSRLLALAAAISALLGALALTDQTTSGALDTGLLCFMLTIALLGLSLILHQDTLPSVITFAPQHEARLRPLNWLLIMAGVIAIALFTDISSGMFETSEHVQFALLCGGCALLIAGFGGRQTLFSSARRLEIGGVLLLTGLALMLRMVSLERTLPAFIDEVSFSTLLSLFEQPEEVRLLLPINTVAVFPRLYGYFQWVFTELLGRDLNSFRLISALLGGLTVPAVYLLCKHLFDVRVAVIAALLLTTLPLHLQMSRVGLNNVGDPLFGALAFGLIARGLRYGGRVNFAAGGVALGWTQYFHEAGRLTLPVIALLWMLALLMYAEKTQRMTLLRRLMITVFCAVVVGIPYTVQLTRIDAPLAGRVNDVGLGGDYWGALEDVEQFTQQTYDRARRALARVLQRPEVVLYYAGETPYLLYFFTPALVVGFGYALWRLRHPGMLLLLLWLLLPFGGIAVLLAEIQSPRMTVFLPAIAMLGAVGIVYGLSQALTGRWLNRIIIAVVVSICAGQTVYYFAVHLPTFTRQVYQIQPWQQLIFTARELPSNTEVHIISDPKNDQFYLQQVFRFMGDETLTVQTHLPGEVTPELLNGLSRERYLAFIVQTPNAEVEGLLRETYPLLWSSVIRRTLDRLPSTFVLYLVP